MRVLVLNPGSSSLKMSLFEGESETALTMLGDGELSGIGTAAAAFTLRDACGIELAQGVPPRTDSMRAAIGVTERALAGSPLPRPNAVGYRVVHPGPKIQRHQRVTPELLSELKDAVRFAPLHDATAIELIEETMARMPDVPHFACFDTVFHGTMPEIASKYALPPELEREGVRRYGFHGLSCESVVAEMRERLGDAAPARLVIAHLGSGCSVTACLDGRSVDTTMGLTPTGGVVMGTRPGDLDPGLVLYLLRRPGATVDSVEAMLNHGAGLMGLAGVSDMRELHKLSETADASARLAIEIFVPSVARAIAGMMVLYATEALFFTGGIGEHDAELREKIAEKLARLDVKLDAEANSRGLDKGVLQRVSAASSAAAVYVARAEEDRVIARHVLKMCSL